MAAAARLLLFGVPALVQGADPRVLPFERRSQLLALLALEGGWVGRRDAAALLWPEQDDRLAATNLRKTLFRLATLPWGDLVQVQGGSLRFDGGTDIAEFEQALRDGRAADAVALRRGELLAGFDDDGNRAWAGRLAYERERLRVAWRAAALAHLEGDMPGPTALSLSAQLLEIDPYDEAALRAHAGWLARTGQEAASRQVVDRFVERLGRELGLAPSAQLLSLRAAPASAAPAAPAAPITVASGGQIDAGFIGRGAELRRIASLLEDDECRLVSLVGPGGIGKTRLARRALQELGAGFADGGAWVSLEDLPAGSTLGDAMARALELRTDGSLDAMAAVITALQPRRLLLALDNFETVLDQATAIGPLLQACPGLKLLVTSRVRLALAEAWTFVLPGLPCPDPEDLDRIGAFDAVQLFARAARRVQPDFSPTAEAAAIVDICRRLDGLPLALELAAAWTRVLPCAAIAAELRSGADLLRADDATHPARHASMEVVFEQSWQRLVAAEHDALARLSVFRGGFSAEAARAVTGSALPVLSALADKSLLQKEGQRLTLHPVVQQLAAHKLDAASRRTTRAAHAAHFQQRLVRCRTPAEAGERDTLRAIELDLENFHRAWQWALEEGPTDLLPDCAATLSWYFDHRGLVEEGLRWMREAAEAERVQADGALHALLESRVSHLCYRLDRYAEAEALATRTLEATNLGADADPDERLVAAHIQAHTVLAALALRAGHLDEARQRYEHLAARLRWRGRPRQIAGTLDNLALVHKRLGHYDGALRLSLESLAEHRRIGSGAHIALCLNNLGSLYLAREEPAAALGPLNEALALCERDGLGQTMALVQANLSQAQLRLGDLAAARRHVQRCSDAASACGHRSVRTWAQSHGARLSVREGDLAQARAALAEGLASAITLGAPTLLTPGLLAFAELLDAQGHPVLARRCLAFFAAEGSGLPPSDRDEMRHALARGGGVPGDAAPWPGMAMAELLQRIVAEAPQCHASLIAQLERPDRTRAGNA